MGAVNGTAGLTWGGGPCRGQGLVSPWKLGGVRSGKEESPRRDCRILRERGLRGEGQTRGPVYKP